MISLVSAGVGVALVPLSARALRLDNVVYIDLPGSAGGVRAGAWFTTAIFVRQW